MQSSPDGQRNERTLSKDKTALTDNKFLHALPISYFADFYKDLLTDTSKIDAKRAGTAPVIGCDCKVKVRLVSEARCKGRMP